MFRRPRCGRGCNKKRLGLKFAASIRDLTFRELDLPWAHYSMSLQRRKHKFPLAGRAFASVCSRGAAGNSSRTVHAVATAARHAGRPRGCGRCERPSGAIARARRGERPAANRLAGGGSASENVSGSSRGNRLKMVARTRLKIRAWVISKRLPSRLAKKFLAADLAATWSLDSRRELPAGVSVLPCAARLSVAQRSASGAGEAFASDALYARPISAFRLRAGLELCARY